MLFFFNDTATTEIYTLSLHDALPISTRSAIEEIVGSFRTPPWAIGDQASVRMPCSAPYARTSSLDRKSTRLNSSHANISYAVFCLKKKTQKCIVCKLQSLY